MEATHLIHLLLVSLALGACAVGSEDSSSPIHPANRDAGQAAMPTPEAGPPKSASDSGLLSEGLSDASGAKEEAGPVEPTVPSYPPGPYGLKVGAVAPDVALSGYLGGTGSWVSIRLRDYYDPTGSRGIRALLVTAAASWCGACQGEAKMLATAFTSTYKGRGARFLGTLLEDTHHAPADKSSVDAWVAYAKTPFDIAADPGLSLFGGSGALPFSMVINPRTMKVFAAWNGYDPYAKSIPEVDHVLWVNGG